jgi:hypothetical protein
MDSILINQTHFQLVNNNNNNNNNTKKKKNIEKFILFTTE